MTEVTGNSEPGTLVWVGNTSQPEFRSAFQFCRDRVAQLAVRRSPRELVDRPAGFVKRIVFARTDRRPLSVAVHAALQQRYSAVESLALNSALCDGESRTGSPWPNININIKSLRFSRWQEVLPAWIEPCGYRQSVKLSGQAMLVICDRYEMAEPYLDIASSLGQTAIWQRSYNILNARNVDRVLWDDSIAMPTTTTIWRQRIHASESTESAATHNWLVTQPYAAEINAALAAGVSQVFTKPVVIERLFETIKTTQRPPRLTTSR